ncbi:MAG: GMC family oxidoreductase [Alphaproteobacteria bacterium]|nr:GMC family oxidoreductase [Alphaproteobacteria bacterium]MBU0792864.1 GMC family oxidoreductase [Alphaproteobacteria bacterium]MBU0876621.1 GMC family oxidoreductase [Alphaproteobacteria bacterium]MBU1769323.1 GMC family oxidoreductase [Alphaproteobacteria bacterium]
MAEASTQFDAIVVGSGITGGWAAKELTEAGLKVLMIERGRNIDHQVDYATEQKAPWELPFRGVGDAEQYARDYPVQMLNRHFNEFTQGHFVNDRENPYQTGQGTAFDWFRSYQLGGRSLTWGRQCYRWSDYDFEGNKRDGHGTDWPIRYADLAPWYDKVEEFIGVSGAAEGLAQLPDGRFQPAMALNVVEQALRERILAQYPDRLITIGRTANLTQAKEGEGRGACQNRNICARGCSYGAYFSTQSSTLPAAMKTGRLTVVTDAIVERVDYDATRRRVTGVRWVDRNTGERSSASSRIVFLNAGAFNSVQLMLNSASEAMPNGLANASGVLGTHIMDHANTISALAMVPGFEDRTTYGNRPTGIVVPRFRNLDQLDGDGFTRGYSFQGGALQGTWTRGKRMAGIGQGFKDELQKVGPWTMVLVAFAESLPRAHNRLVLSKQTDRHGIPQLEIHFAHGKEELAALADAKREAGAMMAAGGAQVIMGFDQPNNGGTSIHEMGGARMGHDPGSSVLNRWSQAHDVPNLFVTDGAQMSSSACQNPSLTYMALTARACDYAVRELQAGRL